MYTHTHTHTDILTRILPKHRHRRRKIAGLLYINYSNTCWVPTVVLAYKKSRGYRPAKLSNRLSQNIQDVRRSHKVYRETWRVELTAGGKSLAVVKLQRGEFVSIYNSDDATESHT